MSLYAPLAVGAALAVSLLFLGVVMGKTHEPVGLDPNASRGEGVEVATFALG